MRHKTPRLNDGDMVPRITIRDARDAYMLGDVVSTAFDTVSRKLADLQLAVDFGKRFGIPTAVMTMGDEAIDPQVTLDELTELQQYLANMYSDLQMVLMDLDGGTFTDYRAMVNNGGIARLFAGYEGPRQPSTPSGDNNAG